MTVGMGGRTFAQALVFLIVARELGVNEYGAYAAVLAIAGTLGGFSGMGTQMLMLRDVARDPSVFGVSWGRVITSIAMTAPLLFIVYALLAWLMLPPSISWGVVISIGVSELLFAPLLLACISAYQGHERIGRAARLVFMGVAPRALGAAALIPIAFVLPEGTRLLVWAVLYALAGLIAAVYALKSVRDDLGQAQSPVGVSGYLVEGVAFAFGGAALKLYLDIDKAMLARMSTLEAAGAYSAGSRLVDMSMVPLTAFLSATLPRFFRSGEVGAGKAIEYGFKILPLPLLYAAVIGVLMFSLAKWLPLLLGTDYQVAIEALRWLAWLPLVGLPRLMLQSLLIGADKQRAVVMVLAMGGVSNILLNLWLIPVLNWRGAVLATYTAEIFMTVVLLFSALKYAQEKKRSDSTS